MTASYRSKDQIVARYKNADITVISTSEYDVDLHNEETLWNKILCEELETKIVVTWDDLEQVIVPTFKDAKYEIDSLIGTGVHPE